MNPTISQASSPEGYGLDASKIVDMRLDPASDAWSWVAYDTERQTGLATSEQVMQAARDFITQNQENLGIRPEELQSFSNTLYQPFPDQIYVTFQRNYQGLPVRTSFIQLIFLQKNQAWRLAEVNNNSLGFIQQKIEPVEPLQILDAQKAIGLNDIALEAEPKLVLQPRLENGRYEFDIATEFTVKDLVSNEHYKLVLSQNDNRILEAQSNRFHVAHTLTADNYRISYVLKDQTQLPFSLARVDAATTDKNGMFDDVSITPTATLSNSYGTIIDRSTSLTNTAVYSFPVRLSSGNKTNITFNDANPAALNAFIGLQEAISFASNFLTPQQAPILARPLSVYVNDMDSASRGAEYCNAYFLQTDFSLHFFRQGTNTYNGQAPAMSCANTALIKDVMYHEWGHALDATVGVQPGITDGAFSEGIGDITAILATGNPIVGKGFVLNDANSFVRNTDNREMFPPRSQQVHIAGQVIGGTFWDLRQNFVGLLGKEEGTKKTADLFFKHLLVTDRYVDSYQAILRLDDNDNNPATRSPNYCLINKAFAAHNLATAEAEPCLVANTNIKVRVDTDLGNGDLLLVASAPGAGTLAICEGTAACTSTSAGFQELKLIESNSLALKGPNNFYQIQDGAAKPAVFKVKAGNTYTLLSRSAKGVALGTRSLSFQSRDQSRDLSKTLKVK